MVEEGVRAVPADCAFNAVIDHGEDGGSGRVGSGSSHDGLQFGPVGALWDVRENGLSHIGEENQGDREPPWWKKLEKVSSE
tara:strand:- start:747 stop:989 length:243 start_codon:yes stop_codon:yes gene_type:complete